MLEALEGADLTALVTVVHLLMLLELWTLFGPTIDLSSRRYILRSFMIYMYLPLKTIYKYANTISSLYCVRKEKIMAIYQVLFRAKMFVFI